MGQKEAREHGQRITLIIRQAHGQIVPQPLRKALAVSHPSRALS
jgi:hypothetical protein